MHSVKKSTVQLLFFFFLLIFVHLRILNICRFMMVFYFPFMISAQKLTNMRIMKENMRTGNLPANMKKNRVLQIIPCKKDGNLQNKSRLYCLTLCSQSHHVLVLCSIQLMVFFRQLCEPDTHLKAALFSFQMTSTESFSPWDEVRSSQITSMRLS